MKKWFAVLLCMAAVTLFMSGCAAGNASGNDATQSPAATLSPLAAVPTTPEPSISAAPMTSPSASPEANAAAANDAATGSANAAATAAMTPAQAGRLAERIEDAVERLSEVDDAEAVVRDGRVLVAVEFEDQYKAGLTDRMKQMITDAVRNVDDGLTDVQITDDNTLYGQVKNLGERIGQVTGLDELADDFGDLWDRITGR